MSGIQWSLVDSPPKGPVTWRCFGTTGHWWIPLTKGQIAMWGFDNCSFVNFLLTWLSCWMNNSVANDLSLRCHATEVDWGCKKFGETDQIITDQNCMIALVPITRIWIIQVKSIFYLQNPKRVQTYAYFLGCTLNPSPPGQKVFHCADNSLKCIFHK